MYMFRATWEFVLSVDNAALSANSAMLSGTRFLGIPRKEPICKLALFLGIPRKHCTICRKCKFSDSIKHIHKREEQTQVSKQTFMKHLELIRILLGFRSRWITFPEWRNLTALNNCDKSKYFHWKKKNGNGQMVKELPKLVMPPGSYY